MLTGLFPLPFGSLVLLGISVSLMSWGDYHDTGSKSSLACGIAAAVYLAAVVCREWRRRRSER